MSIIKLLTIVLLLQTSASNVQERSWRGIMPLHSTRADVERVLGAPMKGETLIYDTEKERVFIIYQVTPCLMSDAEGRPVRGGWIVPRDTVISLTVYPKTKIQFSELRVDKTKYKEARYPHGPNVVYYNNEEEGRSYAVDGVDGTVRSVSYGEAAGDEQLRCQEQ